MCGGVRHATAPTGGAATQTKSTLWCRARTQRVSMARIVYAREQWSIALVAIAANIPQGGHTTKVHGQLDSQRALNSHDEQHKDSREPR